MNAVEMEAKPLPAESKATFFRQSGWMAITTFVAGQSRGMKIAPPQTHPQERETYAIGREIFFYRAGGYDFMHGGFRVDVKSTKVLNGNLLVRPEEKGKADIYALAIVNGNEVALIGSALSTAVFVPGNLRPLFDGGPPSHVVLREQLRAYEEEQAA